MPAQSSWLHQRPTPKLGPQDQSISAQHPRPHHNVLLIYQGKSQMFWPSGARALQAKDPRSLHEGFATVGIVKLDQHLLQSAKHDTQPEPEI